MSGKSNVSKSEPCVQSSKQQQRHEELLKCAKLPTLHNRRLQDIAILMYKVKNDLLPSYICEIFTRRVITLRIVILKYHDLILYTMVNTHLGFKDHISGPN